MKKSIVFIIIFLLTKIAAPATNQIASFISVVSSPKIAPSGRVILFSGIDYHGLYLLNLTTGEIRQIVENRNAGYAASFSPDGNFVAFKLIRKDGLQIPCLFDLRSNSLIELHEPSFLSGVPNFASDGSLCYSVDKKIFVLDKNFNYRARFTLPNYSNLAIISPDGKYIAFNDSVDCIWTISLQDEKKQKITHNDQGYFYPAWSPDSKKLAIQSLNGKIHIFDLKARNFYNLGYGGSVNWVDAENVIFVRYKFGTRFQLESTELIYSDFQGINQKIISASGMQQPEFVDFLGKENTLIASSANKLFIGKLNVSSASFQATPVRTFSLSEQKKPSEIPGVNYAAPAGNFVPVANGFNAPYFHQVYDVPDWFNGHWACGATSALMALQYYKILPEWPTNCSYPYAHVSSHGRYVCEVYSFNGYIYNIGGYDPDGNVGYGGYGFIIQNNWLDTKGNMAKYARQHGVGSEVDWSPNFSKFSQNIRAAFPVVILNSLTTAGHYILGVGEIAAQHAVKVNDPYGNKNQGYMNYSGKNVIYDWPGYSNGHANLNIVHCFVYMRQGADLTVSAPVVPDTLSVGQSLNIQTTIQNNGTKKADSSQVFVYLSLDRVLNSGDTLLATQFVPEIESSDSVQLSFSVQLPDSLPSYRWWIIVQADGENSLLETSENNNLSSAQFILKGFARIFRTRPLANSNINDDAPEISAYFSDPYFPVISDSIKLFLDNIDFSDSCHVQGNKIIFQPKNPLAHSEHQVRIEVVNSAGNRTVKEWNFFILTTDVATQQNKLTTKFRLFQNYPNPFNSSTTIRFIVPFAGKVGLEIFSPDGSLVREFEFSVSASGEYSFVWNGKDSADKIVSSGIYFCRIRAGQYSAVQRMIFLK